MDSFEFKFVGLFIRVNKYQQRKRVLSDIEKIKICDGIFSLSTMAKLKPLGTENSQSTSS